VFAGVTWGGLGCRRLGMLLRSSLELDGLGSPGLYRLLLFLPYAVPCSSRSWFMAVSPHFGEINFPRHPLGFRRNWTATRCSPGDDPDRHVWPNTPNFMLICTGPIDRARLYEASSARRLRPSDHFFQITFADPQPLSRCWSRLCIKSS